MADCCHYEFYLVRIRKSKGVRYMRSFKLDISKEEAENILTGIYDKAVSNVSPIEMGELSRVFSFKQQNKEYVVHFKNDRDSFDKGKFLYERYLSKLIPI